MHNPSYFSDPGWERLEQVLRVLFGRGSKSDVAEALIRSFAPAGGMDAARTGRAVLLGRVMTGFARDALNGKTAAERQTGIINMMRVDRLSHKLLDRLDRRAARPNRAGQAACPAGPTGEARPETSSWLDAPYEQWLIETVRDAAAKTIGTAKAEAPALPRLPAGYGPAREGSK